MKFRIIQRAGWFAAFVAILFVALSATPAFAQGFRHPASLHPVTRAPIRQFPNQAFVAGNGFNRRLAPQNVFAASGLNQVQQFQAVVAAQTAQQNLSNQQLFYSLNAQTQGTNFGIPFNYSTVANYYAPYFTPYNYPVYPSYYPPYANPYAPSGVFYPTTGSWNYP